MTTRRYRFLRFEPGVDWQHVEPVLLRKLNRLGMLAGKVITVFSGYRTPKHSLEVGGFADDPHTRHIAVDANVNGKPVGSVISLALFKKVGLVSGNQPNFYNGKPDPAHVQLSPGAVSSSAGGTVNSTQHVDTGSAPPAQSVPQYLPPGAPPQPEETVPGIFSPGSGSASDYNPQDPGSLWQLIAAQPLASPESQSYAQRAALARSQ